MTTEGVCHCGHARHQHKALNGHCRMSADGHDDPFVIGARWAECRCEGFDNSILPADGERLEFGKHRVRAEVAETAPAWAPVKPAQ